jgi:hypothetical protein
VDRIAAPLSANHPRLTSFLSRSWLKLTAAIAVSNNDLVRFGCERRIWWTSEYLKRNSMKASETPVGSEVAWVAAPSPARHDGCKKNATAAPFALCCENRKFASLYGLFSEPNTRRKCICDCLFSCRARSGRRPMETPATERARDLRKGSGKESHCSLSYAGEGSYEKGGCPVL